MSSAKFVQVMEKGSDGGYTPLYFARSEQSTITVKAPEGTTVTCVSSSGMTNEEYTFDSSAHNFTVYETGVIYTISGILGEQSASATVEVTSIGIYTCILHFVSSTLNNNSWEKIQEISSMDKGASFWAVGDTKNIIINGALSDGLTLSNHSTWVYIIGFNHNSDIEGTGIAFQGFKTAQTGGVDIALVDSGYSNFESSGVWFTMNNSNSNSGGWKSSRMRSTLLPQVKNCLPSDLTAVIKSTTLYTDNTGGGSNTASYVTTTIDTLYLLAEYEIFGARYYANSAEQNYQQQYTYYSAGNSEVKYKHDDMETVCNWWERSVSVLDVYRFCDVGIGDAVSSSASFDTANFARGLALAFKV